MQLRTEGSFGLFHCARKGDPILAARNVRNRKALLLEPKLYLGDIRVGYSEAGGEFVWGKPLVIERRTWILLRGD
ncbi:MAG: hypothetical protein WCE53_03695 [Candidatus Acidiferrum sp.]